MLTAFIFIVDLSCGKDYAEATISGKHSRFTLLRKNDEIILDAANLIGSKTDEEIQQLKSQLNVKDIYDFARAFKCTDLPELCNLIERQVFYNSAIAKEGLSGDWGQQAGKVILHHNASHGIDELAACRCRIRCQDERLRFAGCNQFR